MTLTKAPVAVICIRFAPKGNPARRYGASISKCLKRVVIAKPVEDTSPSTTCIVVHSSKHVNRPVLSFAKSSALGLALVPLVCPEPAAPELPVAGSSAGNELGL